LQGSPTLTLPAFDRSLKSVSTHHFIKKLAIKKTRMIELGFDAIAIANVDVDTNALRRPNIFDKAMLRFCQEFRMVGGEVEHSLYT